MMDAFGPGIVYVTRTDIANSTPINVGSAQSFSLDFTADVKELYGQSTYALDAARGTTKVSGKFTSALLSGTAWNNAFFGQNFISGGIKWNGAEAGAVPSTTPYTNTVVNSANFDEDFGVIYAATGLPFTKVASAPAIGQYSVAAGVYTYAAADEGAAILTSYTSTVTTGQTLTINNQLIGYSPTFQIDYFTSRNNKPLFLRLYQCQASKLSIAAKQTDYIIPEQDFSAYVNPAGQLGKIVFPEIN